MSDNENFGAKLGQDYGARRTMSERPSLVYVGSVLFRVISRTREIFGSTYNSYGLVIPKEAVVRLGWKPGMRVDIWLDEARKLLVIQSAPSPKAPPWPAKEEEA